MIFLILAFISSQKQNKMGDFGGPAFNEFKEQFLDDAAFSVLRIGPGFGMLFGHGIPKLMKFFGDEPIKFMDFLGLGPTISLGLVVFSEFLCSILLIVGFYTRWAALFLIFTMMVAVFYAHAGDSFGKAEKGFLYLVGYVAIFLAGAGNLSADARLGRSH